MYKKDLALNNLQLIWHKTKLKHTNNSHINDMYNHLTVCKQMTVCLNF